MGSVGIMQAMGLIDVRWYAWTDDEALQRDDVSFDFLYLNDENLGLVWTQITETHRNNVTCAYHVIAQASGTGACDDAPCNEVRHL